MQKDLRKEPSLLRYRAEAEGVLALPAAANEVGTWRPLAVGDSNGAGRSDVVIPGYHLMFGTKRGTFSAGPTIPLSSAIFAVGDFDRYGKHSQEIAIHRQLRLHQQRQHLPVTRGVPGEL
jgi:hypothetical protein